MLVIWPSLLIPWSKVLVTFLQYPLPHWLINIPKQPRIMQARQKPAATCRLTSSWRSGQSQSPRVTQGIGQVGSGRIIACSSKFLAIHDVCSQRVKGQTFPLLQHVEGFHNESGSKITDGTLSVNMKIPLELKQKAGVPRGVERKQRGLLLSLSSFQFSSRFPRHRLCGLSHRNTHLITPNCDLPGGPQFMISGFSRLLIYSDWLPCVPALSF